MKNTILFLLIILLLFSCSKDEYVPCTSNCYTIQGRVFDKLTSESLEEITVGIEGTFGSFVFALDRIVAEVKTDNSGMFTISIADTLIEDSSGEDLVFGDPRRSDGTYEPSKVRLQLSSSDLNSTVDLGDIELYNYTQSKLAIESSVSSLLSVQVKVELTEEHSKDGDLVTAPNIGYGTINFGNNAEVEKFFLFSDRMNKVTLSFKKEVGGETFYLEQNIFCERGDSERVEFKI